MIGVLRGLGFLAGLALGYLLSGFVFGPSVLAVLSGIVLGAVAASLAARAASRPAPPSPPR